MTHRAGPGRAARTGGTTKPPRPARPRRAGIAGTAGGTARAARIAVCGASVAASIGLALLVAGTVFIAVAVPRASAAERGQALRDTLAITPWQGSTIVGNTDYSTFHIGFGEGSPISAADLAIAKRDLISNMAPWHLPLNRGAAWSGLDGGFTSVGGVSPRVVIGGLGPQVEFLYRDALSRDSRLIAGHWPGSARQARGRTTLQIAVTPATAARFGLRPGSVLTIGPSIGARVSGIIRPVRPSSSFWSLDPLAAAPELVPPAAPRPPYWQGAVFVSAAEVPLLPVFLDTTTMGLDFALPVATGQISLAGVGRLTAALSGAMNDAGLIQSGMANPVTISLSTGLTAVLSGFQAQDEAIESMLSLLFVSLAAIGIVAILLASGLVAGRRATEFAVLRARGAALRQVAGRALLAALALAVPAAAAASVAALAVTPGGSLPLAWWLAACVLAAALAGLPVIAVARLRGSEAGRRKHRPGRAAAARRTAAVRRLVAECALAAASVGGIVVLRRQGLTTGHLELYPSAAPVLVAVLAAIVVVRGYPLALQLLLRAARARPGISMFVGLASATRATLRAIVPVFALVLALAVVAFGTAVGDAVRRGEVTASWQSTGADAIVNGTTSSRPLTAAVQRQIAAVPGAAATAAVSSAAGVLGGHARVSVAIVDPASYAAMAAGTPGPPFPAAALARPGSGNSGAAVPVLASAAAAADLPSRTGSLRVSGLSLAVRVAGQAGRIPGVQAGPLVLVPAWALGAHLPLPSVLLITGPRLDGAALTATVHRLLPGAAVTLRSKVLAALSSAPLPHGAELTITEAAVAAAAFSALILLLSLLITAQSRQTSLARLATMGLGRWQARLAGATEMLPQVLAAVAGGVATAVVLAPLLAPAIDLSSFTGTPTGVPIRTEPVPLTACAVGLVLLSLLALVAEAGITRRRGTAFALRIGG